MSDKIYRRLLLTVTILGAALTVAHVVYACYAYQHASIIQFIAKELW